MTRIVESDWLAGLSVRTVDGDRVVFVAPPDDPPAGVREPVEPAPVPPSLSASVDR